MTHRSSAQFASSMAPSGGSSWTWDTLWDSESGKLLNLGGADNFLLLGVTCLDLGMGQNQTTRGPQILVHVAAIWVECLDLTLVGVGCPICGWVSTHPRNLTGQSQVRFKHGSISRALMNPSAGPTPPRDTSSNCSLLNAWARARPRVAAWACLFECMREKKKKKTWNLQKAVGRPQGNPKFPNPQGTAQSKQECRPNQSSWLEYAITHQPEIRNPNTFRDPDN